MIYKSRSQIEVECNFIRQYMEQNLELGKSHEDIIKELGISRSTYFRHVKRIMDQDAEIWDKVHMDSAKYRATQLMDALLNCVNLCKQIMNDPKSRASDRIEAAKTLCIAETNIFKIIQEGPVFKVSLPLFPKDNNQQESIKDNNNSKQVPN